jgi:hypothetical protein
MSWMLSLIVCIIKLLIIQAPCHCLFGLDWETWANSPHLCLSNNPMIHPHRKPLRHGIRITGARWYKSKRGSKDSVQTFCDSASQVLFWHGLNLTGSPTAQWQSLYPKRAALWQKEQCLFWPIQSLKGNTFLPYVSWFTSISYHLAALQGIWYVMWTSAPTAEDAHIWGYWWDHVGPPCVTPLSPSFWSVMLLLSITIKSCLPSHPPFP